MKVFANKKFPTKVFQSFGELLGYSENIPKEKNTLATFWATLGNFGPPFIPTSGHTVIVSSELKTKFKVSSSEVRRVVQPIQIS